MMIHDELLHKWYNNELTKEELEIFSRREEYGSLIALKEKTGNLSPPDFDSEKMLKDILAKEKKGQTKTLILEQKENPRRSFLRFVPYGVAASILFLASFFFLTQGESQVVEFTSTESKKLSLPDESMVMLGKNSEIKYDEKAWEEDRSLDLKGSALFTVKKGSKFSVHAALGQVAVLGTIFHVESTKDIMKVECKEGSVSVLSNMSNTPKEILKVGETSIIHANGSCITMKKDRRKFKNTSVDKVLGYIAEDFQLQLGDTNFDLTKPITCNYKTGDMENALDATLSPLGMKYKVEGSTIILSK